MENKKEERINEIKELLKSKLSYANIGKKFGISRQRVHQIITGYKSPENKPFTILSKKSIDSDKNYTLPIIHEIKISKEINGGRDRHREIIRKRDNYTCQGCGKIWTGGRRFDVHHKDCKKEKTKQCDNLEVEKDNLITLCHRCHLNLPEHRKTMMLISRIDG